MPVHRSRMRRLRTRLRRSSTAWWTAVVALAAVTWLTVDSTVGRASEMAARFGDLRTVPVVVAAIPAGATVDAASVRYRAWPSRLVPPSAVARDAVGRTAVVPLEPGEILLESKLAGNGRGASALLPPGTRAIAVPSGPGGRPPVEVGDRVDLLATFANADAGGGEDGDGTAAAEPTVVVASSALVVDIDRESDTISVAVSVEEAAAVAYAITAGAITVALTGD